MTLRQEANRVASEAPPARRTSATAASGHGTHFNLGTATPSQRGATDEHLRLVQAIERARDCLLSLQRDDGHWCGPLIGDSILESEYILLLAWLGQRHDPRVRKAARRLASTQLPDGGWSQYPGGAVDVSASVKAYLALKLAGHDAVSRELVKARRAILADGGADAVNSFTRFLLALLGQVPYECCPAVPPEAVLLPAWFPLSIYQVSAPSRTILVPLSVVWACRPAAQFPAEQGIGELVLSDPRGWPLPRRPGAEESRGIITWERVFGAINSCAWWCERNRIRPLRRRALAAAERWMIERFEQSDGLGAIFPPIVWSIVALKCLGHGDDSPQVRYCLEELHNLVVDDGDGKGNTVRLEPCKSPVWDTALSLRALASASIVGRAADPPVSRDAQRSASPDESRIERAPIHRAAEWLLHREVRRPGDWAKKVRNTPPTGWYFEYRNEFYPDVDDTIMVMMGLREAVIAQCASEHGHSANGRSARISSTEPLALRAMAACDRGMRWVLAMQNRDGGWGAFDRDNDHEFLTRVPFADHNAMIDPSTPDITARVLEMLGGFGTTRSDRAVQRAIDRGLAFLRRTQESDGAWPGRWGVNYIYGTWQVLVGMAAVGVSPDDAAMIRGAEWLVRHQQPCGGWGESPDSYADPSLRGRGNATASQTAWALLGLHAAGRADDPAFERGIAWLLDRQLPEGDWHEPEFTGTGFPRVFYLRYDMYRLYFPLMALASAAAARAAPATRTVWDLEIGSCL